MMSSAQRELVSEEGLNEAREFHLVAPVTELKQEVAARLAAHRRRRGQAENVLAVAEEAPATRRQNAVATAVAERYAQTPSYRAFLAEQARHAAEEAAAKAEVARRNAEAMAAVRQELLGELEMWDAPQEFSEGTAEMVAAPELKAETHEPVQRDAVEVAGLRVRLYEDLGERIGEESLAARPPAHSPDAEESQALDAEIAFRKSPVFEDYKAYLALDREPSVPLPANLLEFPRQLIAARKARPRFAEGPLRDEPSGGSQLRIFEVEPEQISTAPAATTGTEWTSLIRLEAHTAADAVASDDAPLMASLLPPQTAPMALRVMAGLVDVALVLGAVVAFVAMFAKVVGQVPMGLPAGIALAAITVAFSLAYQLLFFSFSEQTPGMRYAKIGLCTFADENPTRAAMRRRIVAQIVAACPMGLGLLWSLLDDDGLGWHDRISRMYQRAY